MATSEILNFIGGEHREPIGGAFLENVDPSVGRRYSAVPRSDHRDVGAAVEAAKRAFPQWSRTPAGARSATLMRIADLIDKHSERLALAECIDNGKPLELAKSLDIPRAASNFRFFATAILHDRSESHATDQIALNYTLRQPHGVTGLISPWNLPLYLFTWKVAPAIATGNTAVGKPSEITPATAHILSEICQEADLPPGVLNIVHGTGPEAGAALVEHPDVPAISFTGGTKTGAELARVAAPMFKKLSLELGGKNPFVVFDDADLDDVVETGLRAAFANQGQICLCGSRILVQEGVHDELVERFAKAASTLQVGDPLDASTDQGALVSKDQLEKVRLYVTLARQEGGEIHCGGKSPDAVNERCQGGYFYEPTVVTGLPPGSRVNQEEIFGPVTSFIRFRDEAEALEIANGTPFGLAASVWTQNLGRAHRFSSNLDAGTIWVNCWMLRDLRVPFGGMKQSGVGREGGEDSLRFFTESKNVCIRLPQA